MSDLWEWIRTAMDGYYERRDADRYEMGRRYFQGMKLMETDPEEALNFFLSSRELAEQFSEPWWAMLCDHWRSQTLTHRTRAIAEALDVAQNAVSVIDADAAFADFPQRVCLHDDRIGALLLIDPNGHVPEISDGCDYIEKNGTGLEACQHCARMARVQVRLFQGILDEAETLSLAGLKECRTTVSEHYASQYYAALCRIAAERFDWEALGRWAKSGDIYYGKMGSGISNIELLMWNALALSKAGQDDAARAAYRKARSAKRQAGYKMSAGYCDALAGYLESSGKPRLALIARDMELRSTTGAPYLECRSRLERVRLLTALGKSIDEESALLTEAASHLRDPEPMLAKLRSLT